jgi:hypothetical protein
MPVATIKDVVTTLQTAVGAVSGIKSAPSYPPEQAADFPFVVTYPDKVFARDHAPDQFGAWWDVNVEFHLARKDLPSEVQKSLELAEPLFNAVLKTLRDNFVPFDDGIDGGFTEMVWGDVQTIGYRLTIKRIKILTAIT